MSGFAHLGGSLSHNTFTPGENASEIFVVIPDGHCISTDKPVSKNTDLGLSAGFLAFWREYPSCTRKVNKRGCWKIWKKEKLEKRAEEIISGLRRWKSKWEEDGGKFIPLVTTWLNQQRWETQLETSEGPRRKMTDEELDLLFGQ